MKKSLLALAVLGAFASVASAQSSVTVYGIVDASIARVDNGDVSKTSMDSGRNAASRIGFKGVEDLGNGLKANFTLESGFNVDTGANANPAALFSRLAFVGLDGGFGKVRMGRQNSPARNALSTFDPFENAGVAGSIDYFVGGATPERVSNQITYLTPNFSGFDGEVAYVFGEAEGSNSANRGYAARLGYGNGPIKLALGYANNNTTTAGVDVADTKVALLGATYDFGAAMIHAGIGEGKADSNQGLGSVGKVRSALVGVTVPFGASKVRASYIRSDDRLGSDDSDFLALSYTYDLSKRTSMYATYARAGNDNGSANGIASLDGVAGETSNGIFLGVQHKF